MERIKTGMQGRSKKKAIRVEKKGSRHFTCRTSLNMMDTSYTTDTYNECLYIYIYTHTHTHTHTHTYITCLLGNSVNHRTVLTKDELLNQTQHF